MRLAVFADSFPVLSETFVVNEIRALRRLGHDVLIVAGRPGKDVEQPDGVGDRVLHLDGLPVLARLRDTFWLLARHPRGCVRDLRDRGRWRPKEQPRRLSALAPAVRALQSHRSTHLHAHFAAHGALDALRAGRILGLPVSVTAHAFEIFRFDLNLVEKLCRADLVTSGCDYNVRHLRSLVADEHAQRIHKIVMGVDGTEFRRRTPYAGGTHVVAVGRLVEKKGFADLIDAVALSRASGGSLPRVTIAGEGPLRPDLEGRIAARGLGGCVELVGARTPDQVRELLEGAAVAVMACVVSADGDRDSMPVVVKEAMAMEVPVIATEEVGLPELVDHTVGRLVAPGDPAGLASAIDELLALDVAGRAALGQAGRARVLERCNVDIETARLVELIEAIHR